VRKLKLSPTRTRTGVRILSQENQNKADRKVVELREVVGDLAKEIIKRENYYSIVVDPGDLKEAVLRVMSNGYDYLLNISGVDEPKKDSIRVVYHFTQSSNPKELVAIEVSLPRAKPEVDSIANLHKSAYFMEREEYEMLGVVFKGHPDLRHLLLPPDWPEDTYPLRKDFRVVDEPNVSRRQSKPIWVIKPELKPKEEGAEAQKK